MKTSLQMMISLPPIRCIAALLMATILHAEDWPMFGRDRTRNPVSPEQGAPVEWDVKTGRNIKWRATLGGTVMGSPVVANGLVWIGTNNDPPSAPGVNADAPILKCFGESDGQLLWQYVALPTNGLPRGMGLMGFHSSPLIEGDRAWMTTRYAQVHCLDISPLRVGGQPPKTLWTLDMFRTLDVRAFHSVMSGGQTCSIGASYRDRIYVITGNGIAGWLEEAVKQPFQVRSPGAPSLLCLDRNSGKVLWQDNSPGTNILYGQWGSPLAADIAGRGQVVAPMGDGWVRSFDALTGELLWKLNINSNSGTNRYLRNHFLNAPVLYEERIYIGGGSDPEAGEAPGRFFCIEAGGRGDLSLELPDGPGKGKANPSSGVSWHFDGLGRTMAQAAIKDGLVIAAGFNGFVYCLDARTGRQYWQHDMKAHVVGSPLIVDRQIYVGDEDGDVCVLGLGREKNVLSSQILDSPLLSSPIFANGVLYLADSGTLYAIRQGARSATPKKSASP